MKKKDGKDEWRSIPTGPAWHERAISFGLLLVGIALFIALLGYLGFIPLRFWPFSA